MNQTEQIAWLRERLTQPLPGADAHAAMFPRIKPMPVTIPTDARVSAVLALLFFKENVLHLLFIRRTSDRGAHSAQISFPGGRQEPTDATLAATALRETEEEIGLHSDAIEVLGALTSLYIPVSNFRVFPFLGYAKNPPAYQLSPDEVDYVLEIPISHLLDEERRITTNVTSPAVPEMIREVKAFRLGDDEILWGATAMITAELAAILAERFSH